MTAATTSSATDCDPATTGGDPQVRSRWWYIVALALLSSLATSAAGLWYLALVAASLGGPLAGLPIGALEPWGPVQDLVWPAGLRIGLAGACGVWLDANRVRNATEWSPSPNRYAFGVAAATFVLPPVVAAISAYYLYRRHRHVGTP